MIRGPPTNLRQVQASVILTHSMVAVLKSGWSRSLSIAALTSSRSKRSSGLVIWLLRNLVVPRFQQRPERLVTVLDQPHEELLARQVADVAVAGLAVEPLAVVAARLLQELPIGPGRVGAYRPALTAARLVTECLDRLTRLRQVPAGRDREGDRALRPAQAEPAARRPAPDASPPLVGGRELDDPREISVFHTSRLPHVQVAEPAADVSRVAEEAAPRPRVCDDQTEPVVAWRAIRQLQFGHRHST